MKADLNTELSLAMKYYYDDFNSSITKKYLEDYDINAIHIIRNEIRRVAIKYEISADLAKVKLIESGFFNDRYNKALEVLRRINIFIRYGDYNGKKDYPFFCYEENDVEVRIPYDKMQKCFNDNIVQDNLSYNELEMLKKLTNNGFWLFLYAGEPMLEWYDRKTGTNYVYFCKVIDPL